MDRTFDLVVQLGSQVHFKNGFYEVPAHTQMRTEAAAFAFKSGIAPRLMVLGGSNFGVRYDEEKVFGAQHPNQKTPIFTFEAFSDSDQLQSEAQVIKRGLVKAFDIPSNKVFAETLSATTEENAEFLKIILRRRPMFTGEEKIGLLTLLYHMERALPIFQKAGLNIEPLFAENLLVEKDQKEIDEICQYYSTPKGGKQYPVDQIRQLLTEGKSLEEMLPT